MKKIIGKVSEDEKNEIRTLFERRNGLSELAKIIDISNDELYEKMVADMGMTESRFQDWWNRMSAKYFWEKAEDAQWEIDFNTCEISLIF